jgi:hypothetical protein
MTNPVIEEIYSLASAALHNGKQDAIQVHVFPFRMTEQRLKAYASNEWADFWRNLKDVSDSFERTHAAPHVTICEGRYWVEDGLSKDGASKEEVASQGPLAVCAASQVEAASKANPDDAHLLSSLGWPLRPMVHPALLPSPPAAPMLRNSRDKQVAALSWALSNAPQSNQAGSNLSSPNVASPRATTALLAMTSLARSGRYATATGAPKPHDLGTVALSAPCSRLLPSCRHWIAIQNRLRIDALRAHVIASHSRGNKSSRARL